MDNRGRPPAIKSVNELDSSIEKYKIHCLETEEPFTIVGLACFMGINKDTLVEYGKKEDYSVSYKKALMLAEKSLVDNGLQGKYNPTLTIFLLKNNHNYKDKTETKHSGNLGGVLAIPSKVTDDEWSAAATKQQEDLKKEKK